MRRPGARRYFYRCDGEGNLVSFNYKCAGDSTGVEYFYVRNSQGDIISLLDEDGTIVVEYRHDAWGNCLGINGSLASSVGVDNAYMYRGYWFDVETKLYYLQSRYYNPETLRFLNADSQLNLG